MLFCKKIEKTQKSIDSQQLFSRFQLIIREIYINQILAFQYISTRNCLHIGNLDFFLLSSIGPEKQGKRGLRLRESPLLSCCSSIVRLQRPAEFAQHVYNYRPICSSLALFSTTDINQQYSASPSSWYTGSPSLAQSMAKV